MPHRLNVPVAPFVPCTRRRLRCVRVPEGRSPCLIGVFCCVDGWTSLLNVQPPHPTLLMTSPPMRIADGQVATMSLVQPPLGLTMASAPQPCNAFFFFVSCVRDCRCVGPSAGISGACSVKRRSLEVTLRHDPRLRPFFFVGSTRVCLLIQPTRPNDEWHTQYAEYQDKWPSGSLPACKDLTSFREPVETVSSFSFFSDCDLCTDLSTRCHLRVFPEIPTEPTALTTQPDFRCFGEGS